MDIDLEKAKKEFLKYTENYDLKNENIKRKREHSLRVMNISIQIAKQLELNQEQIELAALIGLLHDIARFEQYTQYKTYKDSLSFDHGDYGEKILEKDIRRYIQSDKYDNIIKKAVKNHNKYSLEKGLDKEEMLFSRLIRDADKIDILYESVEMFWKGEESEVEESKISNKAIEQFKKQMLFKKDKIKNHSAIDEVLTVIAFIFDIQFKSSLEIIKNENYINNILNRYKMKDEHTTKTLEELRIIANYYINEQIQGGSKCQ